MAGPEQVPERGRRCEASAQAQQRIALIGHKCRGVDQRHNIAPPGRHIRDDGATVRVSNQDLLAADLIERGLDDRNIVAE